MTTPSMDQVVSAYLKLRGEKTAIEAEADEKVRAVKAKMEKLESYVLMQADTQGVTSFKTPMGTAFVSTTDFANVGDWDAVMNFVKTHDAFDMLERRVSKAAVRAYMDRDGTVPDGVNFGTKLTVNVRKPTTKVED